MSKTYVMTWGCPNCFKPVSGISDEDGYVRIICHNCGSKMVMKKMMSTLNEMIREYYVSFSVFGR